MDALIDKYTKEELQNIVEHSSSLKEVVDKLGYSTHSGSNSKTVKTRLDKYEIDYSHFQGVGKVERNPENIFIENSTASQQTLRRWYKKGNYTPYKCSICGMEPIWQGKELTLILDHINGQNYDDRLENLRWVCPNCNQQLETTGFKGNKYEEVKRIKKRYYCIDCGKEISSQAERCQDCAIKIQMKVPKEDRPTREQLKNLIRNMSFVEIGRRYNVSNSAIRKWCKKEGLPATKKEINSYSDENWDEI